MHNSRRKIVLVDDSVASLTQGRNILKASYEVYPAPSAAKLFEILQHVLPDLILLDVDMPDVNGYDTIRRLKEDPRFAEIPVIFLSAKNDADSELEGFNLGAVDYVTKPFSASLLLKRIERELAFARQTRELVLSHRQVQDYARNLEAKVNEKVETIVRLQNAVLATVTDLVEFRDKDTGGHIMRTQRYLEALIEELIKKKVYSDIISQWNINNFLASAQLHDVGKIAISDTILCKQGPLNAQEFEKMKEHVPIGVDTIKKIMGRAREHMFLRHALAVVGTHHERWDGAGYPVGLQGRHIPLEGRLMAVADVYDALVSVRPYKNALSHDQACVIIEENAGRHFDPVLVAIFHDVKDQFVRIKKY